MRRAAYSNSDFICSCRFVSKSSSVALHITVTERHAPDRRKDVFSFRWNSL